MDDSSHDLFPCAAFASQQHGHVERGDLPSRVYELHHRARPKDAIFVQVAFGGGCGLPTTLPGSHRSDRRAGEIH